MYEPLFHRHKKLIVASGDTYLDDITQVIYFHSIIFIFCSNHPRSLNVFWSATARGLITGLLLLRKRITNDCSSKKEFLPNFKLELCYEPFCGDLNEKTFEKNSIPKVTRKKRHSFQLVCCPNKHLRIFYI
jgi:hypothetical protein